MTHPPPSEQPGSIDTGVDELFQHVVELAKLSLPEVAEASVTVVLDTGAHTPACTGDLAAALDDLQYQLGLGPCLMAASAVTVESIRDMAAETRWPGWTAGALRAGARSSLSVAVPISQTARGALNLYASTPDAFDNDDIALAQSLAGYASLATAEAHIDEATITLTRHIDAVTGREAVVEQAKGLTMVERRCTADEALTVLTATAEQTGRTVGDVARAVVERATGIPG